MSCKKCTLAFIAWLLVVIGALNWGLVGAFGFNLVNYLLGAWPKVENIVYILVGLSALVSVFGCRCQTCKDGMSCNAK